MSSVEGNRRGVVITGAAGRIGRSIRPLLPRHWDVAATDLVAGDGVGVLDVTDADGCREAFAGADAVVHLAAVPDPDASWEQLHSVNVVGAYTVASAAATAGVRRLVLASSLHAVSALPDGTQSRPGDAPTPANLYGATKAWAEALGGWLAATTDTSVVALRIGYFLEARPDPAAEEARELSAWLSPRDAAELVQVAVEAEGPRFAVANGISANRYRIASLDETTRTLNYRPVDDAWATD